MPRLTPGRPATGPVGIEEASTLLMPLKEAGSILIAVSGGPDSMALMHLAALVRRQIPFPPMAVASVNHGLQDGSDKVTSHVNNVAQDLGFSSFSLHWEGPKPKTGLQNAARQERYRLLTALARDIRATHLLTAHTLDDQAETVLFRLARGSGPSGLVAMRRSSLRDGLVHDRPFLTLPKQRLVETCQARGWPSVEDPANRDPRFARARLRRLLPSLAEEGLDADTFALLSRRLGRDEEALRGAALALLARASLVCDANHKILAADMVMSEPEAIALRALEMVLTDFARSGPPRLGRLENLLAEMIDADRAGRRLTRTLHGHLIVIEASRIIMTPEGTRQRGRR